MFASACPNGKLQKWLSLHPENEAFRDVFFQNRHTNFKLNLVLALALKSTALY